MFSWYEAEAYCRYMDKRLPSEAEWEKAARGPEGYEFGFGNNGEEMDSKANGSGEEDGYEYTAPVIVERFGANGYGLYHMSGNVWEWVEDWYDQKFYDRVDAKSNPVNNEVSDFKVFRGGSWSSFPEYLRASLRNGNFPSSWISDIGFRCARTL